MVEKDKGEVLGEVLGFGLKSVDFIPKLEPAGRPMQTVDLPTVDLHVTPPQDPHSFDNFEGFKLNAFVILTGKRKAESLSVIERLRAERPGENIVRLGVGLKDPSDMGAFYFQYAEELKGSALKAVRENPNDVARGHITRMANHVDKNAVSRWQEFFATGTLSADTTLAWLNPSSKPLDKNDSKIGGSWGDLLAQERELAAQTEAELARTKLSNIRAEAVLRRQKINAAIARRASGRHGGTVATERELIAKGFMLAPVQIERPAKGLRLISRSASSER